MTGIAVFQMSAAIAPEARPDRIVEAMRNAAKDGARLLIAPELCLSGYGRGAALRDVAEAPDGVWAQRLCAAAAEFDISVIASFPERAGETRHISAMIVDRTRPDPQEVQVYRKGCLYGAYEKEFFTTTGPSTLIVDLEGLKVGCLICYDVEFPENVRRLALAGAELIAVPTALPRGAPGAFIAQQIIGARAFENQVFVAYANNADSDDRFTYQGASSIAAPDGDVLASAGETGDALIHANILPATYGPSRDENPYLEDARQHHLV